MIDHLSISQLQLYRKNPRRYMLQYVEGIRDPETEALRFGKLFHSSIEAKLKRPSDCAGNFIIEDNWKDWKINEWYDTHHDTKLNWRIEDRFRVFLTPALPPIEGCIDLWALTDDRVLHVEDHKTANKRYIETEDSLKNNWQLSLYRHVLTGSFAEKLLKVLVAHNQFIKDTSGGIAEVRKVVVEQSLEDHKTNMTEIKLTAMNLVDDVDRYHEEGLQAIRETPENKFWYGKIDPLWDVISGQESVESYKDRVK